MKFTLPTQVWISKNKKFILNLNNYRNAHFQVLNKAKKEYTNLLILLRGFVVRGEIELRYTLYRGTRRKCDIANILCIVDKFFCDALQKYGCIEEDDFETISKIIFKYGGYDKGNERVEVEIISSLQKTRDQ